MPNYHISEYANNQLIIQAQNAGFIKSYTSANGLSKYIKYLATCQPETFIDARPDNVKQTDITRLKSNQLPFWIDEQPRLFRRKLQLNKDQEDALLYIANYFCITNHNLINTGLDKRNSQLSTLLESIGIGWLKHV